MTATAPVVDAVVDAGPEAPPAGAALRVVVVNGSPNEPSKTAGLVDVVLDTLAGMLPVQTSRVDVYRLGPGSPGPSSARTSRPRSRPRSGWPNRRTC